MRQVHWRRQADSGVRAKALEGLVLAIGNRTVDAPSEWNAVHANPGEGRQCRREAADQQPGDQVPRRRGDSPGDGHRRQCRQERRPSESPRFAIWPWCARRAPRRSCWNSFAARTTPNSSRKRSGPSAASTCRRFPPTCIAQWGKLTPPLRNEVVQILAGRKDWARDLLAAVGYEKGRSHGPQRQHDPADSSAKR